MEESTHTNHPQTSQAAVEALLAGPSVISDPNPPVEAGKSNDVPEVKTPTATNGFKRPRKAPEEPKEPLSEVLLRRLTTIKEGDNVLLRLPSDSIKAVVASRDGLVQLGKFGSFPGAHLLGLHYDITYEITPQSGEASGSRSSTPALEHEDTTGAGFGQAKSKKSKKGKGRGREEGGGGNGSKTNPGWRNVLRPLRRQPVLDAVIDDITETNEFIDDTDVAKAALLTHEEIADLRAQGITAEEMIQKQMERHERFGLKTDFSKEKWRKRKEKKFYQTVHPLAPSIQNIITHYLERSPISILHLRDDTLSQLLTLSNIRPGGRYLVVDDTSGLVTAAMLERMGCEGRILTFTDADSPPAWGVLSVMNFGERETSCVKALNWMEADEEYERPPPPPEDTLPEIASNKTQARMRRHNAQVADLNAVRDDLYVGGWDGLVMATELNPLSILSRLLPYVGGSSTITIYSPYLQILAEVMQFAKKDPRFLNFSLTDSWTRTYQVLPGRTHPMMNTSATGGYLFHATRVFEAKFEPESHNRNKRRKKDTNKPIKDGEDVAEGGGHEGDTSGLDEDEIMQDL